MKVKDALELPESMWDKLDAEVATLVTSRPADSFTRAEFQSRYGIKDKRAARAVLEKMVAGGTLKRGGSGVATYYQVVK